MFDTPSHSLQEHLLTQLQAADGWLSFDRLMAEALYSRWGYYQQSKPQIGLLPQNGSDFVTAPEISSVFGQALSVQLREALSKTQTHTLVEFGAGTGALAKTLLTELADVIHEYWIMDLSASLKAQQQEQLKPWLHKVKWLDRLPDQLEAVVVGNEVLDAMPVKLLVRKLGIWYERGVGWVDEQWQWQDRPTRFRPPFEIAGEHDYLTEIHPQAESFIKSLADCLTRGAVFFIDYGFPETEYYHPERAMGTLLAHYQHRVNLNILEHLGEQDLTAHVNFTGIALAAQDAGWTCLGYTSQARFLLNCGILDFLQNRSQAERIQAQKLLNEHEMGELFKVIAWTVTEPDTWDAVGFSVGDRTGYL